MTTWRLGAATRAMVAACALVFGPAPPRAAAQAPEPVAVHECGVDLNVAGQMSDIVSNALTLGLNAEASRVRSFLDAVEGRHADGPALLRAAAEHFQIDEAELRRVVEQFRHINCGLETGEEGAPEEAEGGPPADAEVTAFARDVTLHVVLHEIGHALIREFDLPVLGNEETAADAFATHYLTTHLPGRAVEVLTARVVSLMIEAAESPADDWAGEHDHDGRRAFKIAALAVAADAERYAAVAAAAGMSRDEIRDAADYGAEVHRSWRRVLRPLWMPAGEASAEARVAYAEDSEFVRDLCEDGLAGEIEAALRRFDWHSQVTVSFIEGEGGAGWSRSSRTVTVRAGYVRRFVEQGRRGGDRAVPLPRGGGRGQ